MRDKLVALHAVLWERFQAGDRLVYLGNYMGLGPDVIGTIDELISFRTATLCRAGMEPEDIVFLRGAQEEMWRKLLQNILEGSTYWSITPVRYSWQA